MSGRVDGLLIMSPFVDSQDLGAVLPLNLPLVTIASRIGDGDHAAISVDNFEGGLLAVRHLAALGCRTIAHISGPLQNFEAQERQRGYKAAMQALQPGAALIVHEGEFTEESGYAGMRAFLEADLKPDGLFAANDVMAIGALLALKERDCAFLKTWR